jgi:hypothetical protein
MANQRSNEVGTDAATPPVELDAERKFQAVLARFQDHSEMLRAITGIDLQILGGFMTLQLGLAAWLTDHAPKTPTAKWGLLLLSGILTTFAVKLLYNSYRRRDEVVASLLNTKKVLRFCDQGVYLPYATLDAETTYRPWWPWYVITCCMTFLGVGAIILRGGFA